MADHYDVVVLGAGPGGYVAAIRAAQLGLRTAVVEQKYWGGVCLNVGCIPSKALLRNAELAHILSAQAQQFGIRGEPTMDYGAAFDRSRSVADGRVKGVHYLMKKNGITEYTGKGTFTDPHTIAVSANGAVSTIMFEHAIISTGAVAKLLPDTQITERVLTYEEQITRRELPGSTLIVGAGPIGMEFAYVMRNFGVEVTVVEFLDRVLPNEDVDVSKELARAYKKLGIALHTSTAVRAIEDDGAKVTVTLEDTAKRENHTVTVDSVLQAIGFAPRVQGYGLENTGVELNSAGAIAISDVTRTNVSHIYAIGDVTGKLQLAHVAEAQALVAAETIAGAPTMPIEDYRMMPRATFCQPQVASFGLTQAQAEAEDYDIKVATFPFTANGKAHGLGETTGFVKLICEAQHGLLLGAHLVGPDASELLPELTLAQRWDLTVYDLARNVHTHPSLSEAVQEAVHGLAGHMINF
jgi:dihydrolipoamide dehydrogenase